MLMARILVIDDSVSVLDWIQQILGQAGHETAVASSGKQGGRLLKEGRMDLVITDIYMPDQDGFDVIRQVRQLAPQTPVIAMSSREPESHMLAAARAMGAASTLQKPFSAQQLLKTVGDLLGSPPGASLSRYDAAAILWPSTP